MSVFDDVRRWAKDKWTDDELITGPPPERIRELDQALPQLTARERQNDVEHVKAYATYYYEGHQREPVPSEVRQELAQMEKRAERLNAVDNARIVLEKYGGPPSRETIHESLERSMKEREGMREAMQPKVEREAVQERIVTGENVREFGSVWRQNIVMPSGNLGQSERRSRFEIVPSEDGYRAELSRKVYLRENGALVGERDLPNYRTVYGPFPTETKAKEFVNSYVADYRNAERDHQREGIKHQQSQDKEEIRDRQSVGPRMRM